MPFPPLFATLSESDTKVLMQACVKINALARERVDEWEDGKENNLAQRTLLQLDGWGSGFPARGGVSSREHVVNTGSFPP